MQRIQHCWGTIKSFWISLSFSVFHMNEWDFCWNKVKEKLLCKNVNASAANELTLEDVPCCLFSVSCVFFHGPIERKRTENRIYEKCMFNLLFCFIACLLFRCMQPVSMQFRFRNAFCKQKWNNCCSFSFFFQLHFIYSYLCVFLTSHWFFYISILCDSLPYFMVILLVLLWNFYFHSFTFMWSGRNFLRFSYKQ